MIQSHKGENIMTDEFVQFAQKAIIIKDNKLLMIKKSSKDSNQPNKWEIPGGRKQIGESLDEHIIREVREEVGINIIPKDLFDIWQFSIKIEGKETTVIAVSRFCEIIDDNINITEDVIDKCEWVEINENLLDYNLIPGIRKTIEKLVKIRKNN